MTTGGVWVIDAKRYKGRAELRVEGGILRPAWRGSSWDGVTAPHWWTAHSMRPR
nr:hypothetical protein [Calidifontibacter indicus]